MRFVIVGEKSRLIGGRCRACPNKVRVGESILFDDLGGKVKVGVDDRYLVHTECLRFRVEAAPNGRPVGDPRARYQRMRDFVRAGGDLLDA